MVGVIATMGLQWSTQLKTDRWLDPVRRKEPQGRVGEKLLSLTLPCVGSRVIVQVRGPQLDCLVLVLPCRRSWSWHCHFPGEPR